MVDNSDRRSFLSKAGAFAAFTCLNQFTPATSAAEMKEEDISPVEDLMREHGLLNRLLLIYDFAAHTLSDKKEVSLKRLEEARDIVRSFIESYHEKLEEDHVFPRFEKAKKLTDLVAVLRQQHLAGREVTAQLGAAIKKMDTPALVSGLNTFTRMYRPHEAREDTVLFPVFQSLISAKEYHELGERFEDREHELFGKSGFEGMVDNVAAIEKELGIYDLSQFTPKANTKP